MQGSREAWSGDDGGEFSYSRGHDQWRQRARPGDTGYTGPQEWTGPRRSDQGYYGQQQQERHHPTSGSYGRGSEGNPSHWRYGSGNANYGHDGFSDRGARGMPGQAENWGGYSEGRQGPWQSGRYGWSDGGHATGSQGGGWSPAQGPIGKAWGEHAASGWGGQSSSDRGGDSDWSQRRASEGYGSSFGSMNRGYGNQYSGRGAQEYGYDAGNRDWGGGSGGRGTSFAGGYNGGSGWSGGSSSGWSRSERDDYGGQGQASYGPYYGSQTGASGYTGQLHGARAPKNYTRSDSRIEEDVNDRLMQSYDIDPSNIEVKVASGEVTLSGSVPSRDAKFTAERIAEAVLGVKDVNNQLRVKWYSEGQGQQSQVSGTNAATTGVGGATSGQASSQASNKRNG